MAVGALSWVAPSFSARLFGLDPARQPVVTQLFGVRDFALGFVTATSTGGARKQALRLGMVIDAVDTVAALRGMRGGGLSTQAAILVGGGAALFVAIGAAALAQEENAQPLPAGSSATVATEPVATG